MNLLILLFLAGLGIFSRRRIPFLNIVIIFFLVFMMYKAQNIPDFQNNSEAYKYINSGNHYLDLGVGWYTLCTIGGHLGLTYLQFQLIVYFCTLLIIDQVIRYFLKNTRFVQWIWGLYLIYPALLDAVQVRFLLAQALVLVGVIFLRSDRKLISVGAFVVLVISAYTIHSSAIFYLLFLLWRLAAKHPRVFMFAAVIELIVALFSTTLIVNLASLFVNNTRILRYFQSSTPVGILGILAYSATLVIYSYLVKQLSLSFQTEGVVGKGAEYSLLLLGLSRIAWLILPLTFFDTNFFRLQRPFWFLLFIGVSLASQQGITTVRFFDKRLVLEDSIYVLTIGSMLIFILLFTSTVVQAFLL